MRDEIVVRIVLDDGAALKNDDAIGHAYGEAMRDQYRHSIATSAAKRLKASYSARASSAEAV